MKVNYCQADHFEKVKYYVSIHNTAVCEECHYRFMKDGMECTSIDSLGNAYLCDVRSLRDKWAVVHDEICSKQAKYLLLYEKLYDSLAGTFESFLNDIIKLKEAILIEANTEKAKFLQNFQVDVVESKNKIKGEMETITSHMENIETFLKTSVFHLLLPLIDTVDIIGKVNEINFMKNSLDPLLMKEPNLPFTINRRIFNKNEILSQIEITKNNNSLLTHKTVLEVLPQLKFSNVSALSQPPAQSSPYKFIHLKKEPSRIISDNSQSQSLLRNQSNDIKLTVPQNLEIIPNQQENQRYIPNEIEPILHLREQNLPLLKNGSSYGIYNQMKKEIIPIRANKEFNTIHEENDKELGYNELSERQLNPEVPTVVVKTPHLLREEKLHEDLITHPQEYNRNDQEINQPMIHYIYYSKLYIYDIRREKKYIVDTPPPDIFPSKYFPSIIVRDSIFLCGGITPDGLCLRTTFTFDYISMEFVQRKSMIYGRCKHGLADVDNNIVYIIGGAKSKTNLKECSKYDLDMDKWIYVPPLTEEKCLSTCFSFRNRIIYVIGGLGNNAREYCSSIERLDIHNEDDGWSKVEFKTNGWSGRYAMNNCQLSDQYFLIFGGANMTLQNHCFLYDCNKDTLMFISRLNEATKFESHQSQPILFKDTVFVVDDERNLHMFNIRNNYWSIVRWAKWKPNVLTNNHQA